MPRKPGALSLTDQAFIRNNVDRMAISEIAEQLNRSETPIKRYIREERLGENYKKGSTASKEATQRDILKRLREKPFFKDLREQLTSNEQSYFEDYWVTIITEMNADVLAVEELDLKEMLMLEVMKSRLLAESKRAIDERDEARIRLEKQMKKVESNRDKMAVRVYRETISSSQNYLSGFNKDFKELSEKSNKIKQSLQQTRAKRTEHLEKSAIDFKALVILLNDMAIKERVGMEAEIIKAATQRKTKELSKYYTYVDGSVDRPILNSKTVESSPE